MIARAAASSLGLLAFSVTTLAGVMIANPATLILSRSILALFVFSGIGYVLGRAAQIVVNEQGQHREARIRSEDRDGQSARIEGTEPPMEVETVTPAVRA